jgi:hypothetical protein
MFPHRPQDFPDFLGEGLNPGLARVLTLQPFEVLLLDGLPADANFSHQEVVQGEHVEGHSKWWWSGALGVLVVFSML